MENPEVCWDSGSYQLARSTGPRDVTSLIEGTVRQWIERRTTICFVVHGRHIHRTIRFLPPLELMTSYSLQRWMQQTPNNSSSSIAMSTQTLTQRHSTAPATKPPSNPPSASLSTYDSRTAGPVSSTSMPPMLWHRELVAVAFLGFLGSLYYIIPLALLLTPIGALMGYWWCWTLLAGYVGLAVMPEIPYRSFRHGYVMQCVLEYVPMLHSYALRSLVLPSILVSS